MGLARQQNLPKEPEATQEWSFKKLFQFTSAASAASKFFSGPFDILFAIMILVACGLELFDNGASWQFWVLVILMFFACYHEHENRREDNKSALEKKAQKK